MAGLYAGALIIGLNSGNDFFSARNITIIFLLFVGPGISAMGMVTAKNIKGPDFSLGVLIGLSSVIIAVVAQQYGLLAGFLLSLFSCLLIGILKGALIHAFRKTKLAGTPFPAIITTSVLSVLIVLLAGLLSQKQRIQLDLRDFGRLEFGALVFFTTFALCILALFINGRVRFGRLAAAAKGRPLIRLMAGYALISVCACLAGLFFTANYHAGASDITGEFYWVYVLFLFAVVNTAHQLTNNLVTLLYALVASFILAIMRNLVLRYDFNYSLYIALLLVITAALLLFDFFTMRRRKKRMQAEKREDSP